MRTFAPKSSLEAFLADKSMRNRFLVDFYIGYVCQNDFSEMISRKSGASRSGGRPLRKKSHRLHAPAEDGGGAKFKDLKNDDNVSE